MMKKLEAIERIVLIFASLVALFPLYQFWSESDDRRLDRIANLIAAGEICREFSGQVAGDFGPRTGIEGKLNNDAYFFPKLPKLRNLHDICTEVTAEVDSDTTVLSAQRDRAEFLRSFQSQSK